MFQLAINKYNKGYPIRQLLMVIYFNNFAKASNINCPQGAGAIHLLPYWEAGIQT